jgi:CHAD domain-containing protein
MAAVNSIPSKTDVSDAFVAISRKRLEKFASVFPRVLVSADPDTIHDLRVYSRRFQQILRVLHPKPASKKARKVIRRLRRARRALGTCRNLDVISELLQEKLTTAGNPVARDGLDQLKSFVDKRRREALDQARGKLGGYDLMDFLSRSQALLAAARDADAAAKNLSATIAKARDDWENALDAAKESADPDRLHALRIGGKRLRYSIELLADLGDAKSKVQVKALKALQDQLGDWHDRVVLLENAAEFLTRKDFLASHPDLSRALLVEMDRERRKNESAVANLVRAAEKTRDTLPPKRSEPINVQ